jgi:hypothetical protein
VLRVLKSPHAYCYAETNKEISQLSSVSVKTRLPSARVAYSEICLIKVPHESNNRTVEELEEEADCKPSDCKSHFYNFLSVVLQPNSWLR